MFALSSPGGARGGVLEGLWRGFWKASRELLEGWNGWAEEVGTLLGEGGVIGPVYDTLDNMKCHPHPPEREIREV